MALLVSIPTNIVTKGSHVTNICSCISCFHNVFIDHLENLHQNP